MWRAKNSKGKDEKENLEKKEAKWSTIQNDTCERRSDLWSPNGHFHYRHNITSRE